VLLFCAENSRQRSLQLCWERFLRIFSNQSYVGIASEKAHRVDITLARTAQMTAALSHVDNWPGITNAAAEHRRKKLFRFLKPNLVGPISFGPLSGDGPWVFPTTHEGIVRRVRGNTASSNLFDATLGSYDWMAYRSGPAALLTSADKVIE